MHLLKAGGGVVSELITAAGGAVATVLVGATAFAREWFGPGPRPVLLPDQPEPDVEQTQQIHYVVLCETELDRLLDANEIASQESADCVCCGRNTFQAVYRSGVRRCWTCQTESPAGAR